MAKTSIVLLGTGTPNIDPERFCSAAAVVVDERAFLIDVGPGFLWRAAAKTQEFEALEAANLRYAFITHLHSDHTAGYPELILNGWIMGREQPLEVYGPHGLQAMTDHLLVAYEIDIQARLNSSEQVDKHGPQVHVHEIETSGGVVYQDEQVTVEAFRVHHGTLEAFGYKFTTPDRVIVHTGDTTPLEITIEQAKGCDALIHNVYSAVGLTEQSAKRQRLFTQLLTSTDELAAIAIQAEPKLLILVHQEYFGVSDDDLLAEIRRTYDGRVVSGRDLDVY
ncbi:MAG: MBL fold metallo-hydrolase [Burkholderiales bacterium]|nr:MBL fold metallo-hydrolase [Anaerolineae bacterium]